MPEVTCADCGQRIGADLYTHSITDDTYDLVNLCTDCALTRLQLARKDEPCGAAAGLTASTAAGNDVAPGPEDVPITVEFRGDFHC